MLVHAYTFASSKPRKKVPAYISTYTVFILACPKFSQYILVYYCTFFAISLCNTIGVLHLITSLKLYVCPFDKTAHG